MKMPHMTFTRPDVPDAPLPPDIAELVAGFSALIELRRDVASRLPDWPISLDYDPEALAAGRPLLANLDPAVLVRGVCAASGTMLPTMAGLFPPLAPACERLAMGLSRDPGLAERILAALLDASDARLAPLAASLGLPLEALVFLTRELVAAVLRQAASTLSPLVEDALWQRPSCPVCGGAPDCGMLKEKPEQSEFLIAKAGRLGLHCSLCGHVWRFPRLVCPVCGETDHNKREIFMAAGRERERIHTCSTCGRYLLVLDMVDSGAACDVDLIPIRLVHLDAVAQAKGFTPLVLSAWNQLGNRRPEGPAGAA
jgi:FdhE protein